MKDLTDLEIVKACAEAMGITVFLETHPTNPPTPIGYVVVEGGHFRFVYDPLHDDAQAMALVKRFGICQDRMGDGNWGCWRYDYRPSRIIHIDLNRAICEVIARMKLSKAGKNEQMDHAA